MCGVTRAPAHALLLASANVECDALASRILIDRWLMLRVHTPGGGESLLVAASRLRLALQSLLRRRLVRTKHGETASHTTPFAWCTPFLKDFSRRHSSPALPFQRLTGKTFD